MTSDLHLSISIVVFRVAERIGARGADRELGKAPMASVPAPGELVNVDGEPYIVFDRAWAVGTFGRGNVGSYAFLRLLPQPTT